MQLVPRRKDMVDYFHVFRRITYGSPYNTRLIHQKFMIYIRMYSPQIISVSTKIIKDADVNPINLVVNNLQLPFPLDFFLH
jgi:hypothetical protein